VGRKSNEGLPVTFLRLALRSSAWTHRPKYFAEVIRSMACKRVQSDVNKQGRGYTFSSITGEKCENQKKSYQTVHVTVTSTGHHFVSLSGFVLCENQETRQKSCTSLQSVSKQAEGEDFFLF
jgi:hypothetical protein